MDVASFFRALMQNSGKRAGYAVVIAMAMVYGYVALRGPQGIQALLDKRREIRQLEEQNAVLALENERRRERIRRLQESSSEQEMEIRKQLKLLRPGETTFILPEGPKDGPEGPKDGLESPRDGAEALKDGALKDGQTNAPSQNAPSQ
jgi:cell division protein FtsB